MEKHVIIEILKYKCLKYLNGNLHIKKYFVTIEVNNLWFGGSHNANVMSSNKKVKYP